MTLGERHLSDPPGAMYSNPYILSPSFHDPNPLESFASEPKPPSSPMSVRESYSPAPQHPPTTSHTHLHMHSGSRPHTIHGPSSDVLRYIDTPHSPYDQLFPFTAEDHRPLVRGTSPHGRFGNSLSLSNSQSKNTSAHNSHHSGLVYGGVQCTNSDTSLPSALDAPLDMAFLDMPGGSPTHQASPWTPHSSSHAFNDNDDPLMMPLPHLDATAANPIDAAFGQQQEPQQQPQQQRQHQPQRQQQETRPQPFRTTASMPYDTAAGVEMRPEGSMHMRVHSPGLSDSPVHPGTFSDSVQRRPPSEPQPLSHIHSLPHSSRVTEPSVTASMNMHTLPDAFGSAFAMQPLDPPRSDVSGMSREKSLRLLHSSITGRQSEAGGRGGFHPLSLNVHTQWGSQGSPMGGSAHGRLQGSTPMGSASFPVHGGGVRGEFYVSPHVAVPPQAPGATLDLYPTQDGGGGGNGGHMTQWQHSGRGAHGAHGIQAIGGSGEFDGMRCSMPQHVHMAPRGYSGPQFALHGAHSLPSGSYSAMCVGMQSGYIDVSGAGGGQQMNLFPGGDPMMQERHGSGSPAAPGTSSHAVHEGTQRGGTAMRKLHKVPEDSIRPVMLRATPMGRTAPRRDGSTVGSVSLEGRSKRSAMTLSEMVAKADANVGSAPDSLGLTDTSLHSSSKRTRTSNGTALHATAADPPSVAGGRSPSMHTHLTGPLEAFGVSDGIGNGGGSTHGRSRRSRFGMDPKDEWSLEDWVGRIAHEEAAGSETQEAALREEFLDWETRSKSAPNGKWRGANSRKWGKVGIEMRLTGSVPRTDGPVTQLGRMVCKFVDVVEVEGGAVPGSAARPLGVATATGTIVTPRVADGSLGDDRQVSGGHSGQESAVGGAGDDTVSMQAPSGNGDLTPTAGDAPHRHVGSRGGGGSHRNSVVRHSGRSFSAMQAMEGDEKYVWRLAEIVDKQAGGVKTVLKEKVWLGTYHTPINAAVHHDFYKVVLAVEGCIFTSIDVPTCSAPTGKKKSQKLKLNFPLDSLPELMYKAVRFTQLWNKYKQDAERYVFRSFEPALVRHLVQELIDTHCAELRKHVANNDPEGTSNTVERRSTRTRNTIVSQRSGEISGDLALE